MKRFEFARRVPGRSPFQILWYDVCELAVRVTLKLLYRFRTDGVEHLPREGPVLYVSNHQSFLDPMINGSPIRDRQLTAIAREGLFRFRPFGWLMYSYGAIKIKESGGDAAAMKAALGELKAGRCVLIYPEGARSDDGTVAPFKRGAALLLRRARVPVLPMAIDGAIDVWPKTRKGPRLRGRIGLRIGPVIQPDELLADGADAALDRLRREIDRLRLEVRADLRRRSRGRWPLAGPADAPLADDEPDDAPQESGAATSPVADADG